MGGGEDNGEKIAKVQGDTDNQPLTYSPIWINSTIFHAPWKSKNHFITDKGPTRLN